MLRGKVEFDCAGKFALVQSGSLMHVPTGTVHAFRFGRGGAAMIEFTGAGGAATRMFRHVEPEIPPGPPDRCWTTCARRCTIARGPSWPARSSIPPVPGLVCA